MATDNKKGFNTNSNAYTLIYAAIIVIVVAFLLAFVSQSLKSTQDKNVALDKKKQILAALNIEGLSNEESAAKYNDIVMADAIIDAENNTVEAGEQGGENAGFKLNSADFKEGKLALYICNVDGEEKYVIPVYGMGLWGAIRGFIAINADRTTLYGAYFNHDSETAGLGAEIKDSKAWRAQFKGKHLFAGENTENIALSVKKKSDVKDPSTEAEAVKGATLTSDGVSLMLQDCLQKYIKFFNAK